MRSDDCHTVLIGCSIQLNDVSVVEKNLKFHTCEDIIFLEITCCTYQKSPV